MRTIPIPYAVGSNMAWNTSKPCAFLWVPELDQFFIMSCKPSCRKIVKCSKEMMRQLYSSKERNFWMKVAWTFYSMQCWWGFFFLFQKKNHFETSEFLRRWKFRAGGRGEAIISLVVCSYRSSLMHLCQSHSVLPNLYQLCHNEK